MGDGERFTLSLFQIHDLPPPRTAVAPWLQLIVTHICSLSANHTQLQAVILTSSGVTTDVT